MSDQWTQDGWYYMKARTRIGPVLQVDIVCLVRAEELRPRRLYGTWKAS